MKPTFALDLTRETISLLHRTPKGWLPVGEVAFDAPDLAEALDYMRKTALGLSPLGVATKLILPNSQILYAEIHAPGPSRDEKRQQIAAALEGRTPYAVEDLVFDWSGKGATVKVAVIARETLDEAEGFAVEHRLNPVSFVAIPEDGKFVGEPWFGPSASAATILAEDETVERDRDAVSILHRELPKAEAAAAPEPAPEPVPEPEPAVEVATSPDLGPAPDTTPDVDATEGTPAAALAPEEDLPGLQEALDAEVPAEPTAEPPAMPAPAAAEAVPASGSAENGSEDGADDEPEAILAREELASASASAATAPLSGTPAPAFARSAPAKAAPAPDPDEAPFAHVTDTAAFPDGDGEGSASDATVTGRLSATDLDDDLPPAPPSAAMVAFASRRAAAADTAARPVEGVTRGAGAGIGATKAPAAARATAAKGFPGLVTAPSIPGTRAKPKLKGGDIPRPAMGGPTTVKSPARPGGTFGSVAPARKRTGMVFLVMVGLLLLFLALVGAWASYYLSGRGGAVSDQSAAVTDAMPDIDDELLADMQDPEGMTDPIPEADPVLPETADAGAPATESLPVDAGSEDLAGNADLAGEAQDPAAAEALPQDMAEAAPEPLPEPTPEPAPDTLFVTDVSAAAAPVEQQDEIFLSAMDAAPPALDALALPALAGSRDLLPDPVMPPPAPGTVYQFDANGLLKATPDGIMSPDGVFLIAGKPPRLPPSRSDAAAAAALAAAPAVAAADPDATAGDATAGGNASPVASPSDASLVTAGTGVTATPEAELPPADPAMAGFRPRPRPEGLVPETPDDAALTPETTTDFAGLRPLARPASVTAAAALAPAPVADLGAQGASLTAQAEAKLAEAAALEARNPSIVAISMRPAARPNDFRGAVEAAVAAAVREPPPPAPAPETAPVKVAAAAVAAKPEELDELDEPEVVAKAAPSIPTKASVAKQATYANAINLSKINLIGTYGTDSRRYALIRQSNGKYKKVNVGDKIDGGTVKAITETEVRYQKGGRLISLKMPKA